LLDDFFVDLFDAPDERPRLAGPPEELRPLETDISSSCCSTPTSSECHELSGAGLLAIPLPGLGQNANLS